MYVLLTYLYLNLDPDRVYNSFTTKYIPHIGKESRRLKPTVKCPECYSTELYKNGKDKKVIKSICVKNVVDNLH